MVEFLRRGAVYFASEMTLHAVIMAGGKGTRFWPLSRAVKAKQFLSIIDNTALLELTIHRLQGLVPVENIWIVGSASQKEYLSPYSKWIPEHQILYEPEGKNTAPCIGWAAMQIHHQDPHAVMAVFPADPYIKETDLFQDTISKAATFVEKNNGLMTIGIPPTFPHTGYGYIESESQAAEIQKVTAFREKPDLKTAQQFIEKGSFYWNSGMFIWKTETILTIFQKHLPQHYLILEKLLHHPNQLDTLYPQFESISIDYGIMEKAIDQTYMIPAPFHWNDIGNWAALEDYWPKDSQGNAIQGNCLPINSKNNIIYSEKRLISLVDLDNLIVVDTDDALLILPKDKDQKIKDLYNQLPDQYR